MLFPVSFLLAAPPTEIKVLFVGNSHTFNNNVPDMVTRLASSDSPNRKVIQAAYSGIMLEDAAKAPGLEKRITSEKWDFIVLQGAGLSSSHKYKYPATNAIALAKKAKAAGIKPLLFAEWPRKGWDETGYILGVYGEIAKASGAEIVPVCKVWDSVRKAHPKLELWMSDGNHALAPGTYIAAYAIYDRISGGGKPTWRPNSVPTDMFNTLKGYFTKK